MSILLNPYLSFEGNAREALEFYAEVFEGELNVSTFGEYGQEGPASDQVMHGQLKCRHDITLMAADSPHEGVQRGNDVGLSLSGDEADTMRRWWERLSEGGQVVVPLERQAWGDEFGMCVDRYGVRWLVNIAGSASDDGSSGEQPAG